MPDNDKNAIIALGGCRLQYYFGSSESIVLRAEATPKDEHRRNIT